MLLVGSVPTDSEVVVLGFSPLSFSLDVLSRPWVHYWFFWHFGLSFSSTRLVIWLSLWVRRFLPLSCMSLCCVLVLSMQSPKARNGASLGTRIGGACNHEFLQRTSGPPKWVLKLRSAKSFAGPALQFLFFILLSCKCVSVCVCFCWNLQVVAGAVLNPFLGSQFWAHFGVIIWDPSM